MKKRSWHVAPFQRKQDKSAKQSEASQLIKFQLLGQLPDHKYSDKIHLALLWALDNSWADGSCSLSQ